MRGMTQSPTPALPGLNHRGFAGFGLAWAALLLVVHGPPGWRR